MGLRIDLICSFIDLFSQASTYGDDWFKTTFVKIGIFRWSLDFMHDLKLIIDRLEGLKIFEPFVMRKPEETKVESVGSQ